MFSKNISIVLVNDNRCQANSCPVYIVQNDPKLLTRLKVLRCPKCTQHSKKNCKNGLWAKKFDFQIFDIVDEKVNQKIFDENNLLRNIAYFVQMFQAGFKYWYF